MNSEFINAIGDLEREKGISAEILFDAIEVALITAFKKNFDSNENVRVEMNKENGDIQPVGGFPDCAVVGIEQNGDQGESENYSSKLDTPEVLAVAEEKALDYCKNKRGPEK